MLTFLDTLVISVNKQMLSCLGLGFVILLYRLHCSLIIVCLSMAVLCEIKHLDVCLNALTTVGYLLEVFIRLWILSMVHIFTSTWS